MQQTLLGIPSLPACVITTHPRQILPANKRRRKQLKQPRLGFQGLEKPVIDDFSLKSQAHDLCFQRQILWTMSNSIRRRVCLEVLRFQNLLPTSNCLGRPSYAATYLDIAKRAFSDSRSPTASSKQAFLMFRAVRNKNVTFRCCSTRCCSTSSTTRGASIFTDTCRTIGITTHSLAKAPLDRRKAVADLNYTWRRSLHSGSKRKKIVFTRNKSSTSNEKKTTSQGEQKHNATTTSKFPPESENTPSKNETQNYLHIPKMPHRPTREEVLAAATGFWSGLKLRFKWFSIRSARPWNADDWSAFVSWFFLGHIVWIFVGTTTFFSIVIFTINTVVAQGTLPDSLSTEILY